ncbi:hypothetical protein NST17_20245 [Caldifermentibacillus hisashii]|uniref:Uncharacterized protein n=1 Tax=Caldifermentibacillus hisashii TaxID=996558 RepID=A0ABU9K333_9BACI
MSYYEENLLEETLEILEEHGLTENDVEWVGNKSLYFSFDHFKKIADVDYDSGYGSSKVAIDLIVVGKDWWLERHEYDGSEWWEFKSIPKKPDTYREVDVVVGGMWSDIAELNDLE